jgi:hypothetical protein
VAGPLTNSATAVNNGLFTAELDFGSGVFNGMSYWLEIGVRSNNSGAFILLNPRQELTPAPYGIYAETAGGIVGLVSQSNTNDAPNLIGGSSVNFVSNGVIGATISGGGTTYWLGSAYTNSVTGSFGTVGGGLGNSASGAYSTVSGGYGNQANGIGSFVGGGGSDGNNYQGNVAGGNTSSVGGGENNTAGGNTSTVAGGGGNGALGDNSFVGGGTGNVGFGAGDTLIGGFNNNSGGGNNSTIAGGSGNTSSGSGAFIGGGSDNSVSDIFATIGGGVNNTATNTATEVGGGSNNVSGGFASCVPGGVNNMALGDYSFAAGFNAAASNNNSFVWSDGSMPTYDTSTNEFVARASGGYFFYSGTNSVGVSVAPGSGSWSSMSDRNAKKDFMSVNSESVLARVASMPLTTWSYRSEPGVRHIGPMAQDFHAAFGVGEDDRHITEVDEGGVALAAIQGLNQKLAEKNAQIQDLRQKNDSLAQQLGELKAAVQSLQEKMEAK